MSISTRYRAAAIIIGLALLAPACGGDGEASPGTDLATATGRNIANEAGCAACHGTDGRGGSVGPSWEGLAGSTVTLEDGSQVVADAAYLRRAVVDPSAERSAGFTIEMPQIDLTDDEVAALVAYIQELE